MMPVDLIKERRNRRIHNDTKRSRKDLGKQKLPSPGKIFW